jgi:ribose/xylose/arabinose/galactoside ABC-type transport system permease subunit
LNWRRSPFLWAVALLIGVLVFNLALTPGFFQIEVRDGRLYGSLVDIVNRAVPVLLLAVGMTLVIATGGVDLSVGAVMSIAGAVAACLIARPEGLLLSGFPVMGTGGIVAISLVFALACGLFNGILVSQFKVQPIVATLLLMVTGRGIAQLITNGQIVVFENPSFQWIGNGALAGIPMPIWIFALVALAVTVFCNATAFGQLVASVGSNETASRYAGVNVKAVKLAVYIVCAICAGIAGLIGTADIKAADANNAGLYLELDAILAVAVGGTAMAGGRFSIAGTIVGAILMQAVTTTILTRGVATEATLILKAVIVVAVCLLQSPAFRQRLRIAGAKG